MSVFLYTAQYNAYYVLPHSHKRNILSYKLFKIKYIYGQTGLCCTFIMSTSQTECHSLDFFLKLFELLPLIKVLECSSNVAHIKIISHLGEEFDSYYLFAELFQEFFEN